MGRLDLGDGDVVQGAAVQVVFDAVGKEDVQCAGEIRDSDGDVQRIIIAQNWQAKGRDVKVFGAPPVVATGACYLSSIAEEVLRRSVEYFDSLPDCFRRQQISQMEVKE